MANGRDKAALDAMRHGLEEIRFSESRFPSMEGTRAK